MTKKKNNKQKRQKDISDTSEEELNEASYQGKVCPHVPRAVNFGRVKRILKTGNFSVCAGCTEPTPEGEDPPEVWLCLQCGYRGCGRMSTNQHGMQHFKTIHSDCHSIVLSPSSGSVWCYDCDDEVQLQSSRNLRQCVEFIMKLKVTSKPDANKPSSDDKKPTSNKQSLIETVLKEQTSIKNASSESSPIKNASNASSNKKKENVPSKISVKGLRNLGNTCYFNAVMQNLSQTALLHHALEESCSTEYRWEVPHLKVVDDVVVEDTDAAPLKIALPKEFQLVNTFVQFLKKMSAYSQNKVTEVINPNDLFNDLQRKSPQFQYFLQQDSHELLRQFLDGIRQDEVKRQKKAILRHFHAVNSPPEEIDEDVKKLIKAYGCYASHTTVEKIFGGLLISTVLCEECKRASQVFEPFMDMSLPLFEEKQQENCNQLCPLLDGGKQNMEKALRIRKPDQDIENGEEYVINKSKKDYSKPSKHQEKKLKQMEKKEKKKNKKAQNKKLADESKENPNQEIYNNSIINSNEPVEVAVENGIPNGTDSVDLETDTTAILKTDNAISETPSASPKPDESNHINNIEDGDAPSDSKLNAEPMASCDELENSQPSRLLFNSPSKNETAEDIHNSVSEDVLNESLKDFQKFLKDCPDKDQGAVEPSEQDFVVLFDKKVFLNGEPVATSSPTLRESCEAFSALLRGEPPPLKIEPCSETTENILIADQIEECLKQFWKCKLKEIKAYNKKIDMEEGRFERYSESNSSTSESEKDDESSKLNDTSGESLDGTEEIKVQHLSCKMPKSRTKEWIQKSLVTLKSRQHVPQLECSIDSCLMHFTKPELLTGNNKFRCENCSKIKRKKTGDKKSVVYSNASKQLLIFSPPAILTLHLKRFQQVGMSLRKVNRFVEFPLVLDLASYCSSACLILPHMTSVKNEILYSLYGIVEHSGHLKSGHYTAYVKATKRTLNHSFISQLPLAQCDLEQLLHKFAKKSSSSSENGEETATSEDVRWYYISDCHVRETTEAQVLKCQAYLLFYERIK